MSPTQQILAVASIFLVLMVASGNANGVFEKPFKHFVCTDHEQTTFNIDDTDGMWINWRGSYYILVTDLLTWSDAKAKCESFHEGVHLVFIEDAEEDQFIYDLITDSSAENPNYWIGLSNNNADGVWQWYDQPLVYSNWKKYSTLTEAGYCAGFKTTGQSSSWYTGQCDTHNAKFVCELEE